MMGGAPGPLRFAQPLIAGQITWLVPLAMVGACVAAARSERRWPLTRDHAALLLWGGWLGTHWVVFTFASGIFHEYYTTIMGPAVAALAGIGTVALCREWRWSDGRRGYLPTALILTAAWQGYLLGQYPVIWRWLVPPMAAGTLVGVVGLIGARRLEEWRSTVPWTGLATGVGLAALLIGPACWSLAVVIAPGNGVMPAAEPSSLTGRRGFGGPFPGPPPGLDGQVSEKLLAFLRANHHGERIFVASPSAMEVSPIILRTGENAVSLGGFLGSDPVFTTKELARMVEEGQLRFVLLGGPGAGPPGGPAGSRGGPPGPGMPPPPGGPGGPGNLELLAWVREHGKAVDPKLWQEDDPDKDAQGGAGSPGGFFRRMRRMRELFDLDPARGPVVSAPPAG